MADETEEAPSSEPRLAEAVQSFTRACEDLKSVCDDCAEAARKLAAAYLDRD